MIADALVLTSPGFSGATEYLTMTTATHTESLMTAEEQSRFDSILSSSESIAYGIESASTMWGAFLVSLALEHGPMEAAKRLGTAIAKAKTMVIRNNADGGDEAIDKAMAATDLACNWARKILRKDYKLALKLSKPKRNKVLSGSDEYRLLEVEEVNPGRANVVTPPEAKVSEPEASAESSEAGVRIDATDLDALLNLAVSVHGLEALTIAVMRRNGASPEVAAKLAGTMPRVISTVAKRAA